MKKGDEEDEGGDEGIWQLMSFRYEEKKMVVVMRGNEKEEASGAKKKGLMLIVVFFLVILSYSLDALLCPSLLSRIDPLSGGICPTI